LASEETRERELASLRMVKDHFEKIVLTTDVLFTGTSEDGIKIINLIDWLKE
jgi:predicted AAA+ superfamily ATPase